MIVGDDLFKRPVIVVWFSCGAASAVAAKVTLDRYSGYCDVRIVNNPVQEEDSDNRRFLNDVASWLNHPIEIAVNSKYPDASATEIWRDRKFMSGVAGAPCTIELKKNARYEWEKSNPDVTHMVLGFTADEITRFDRFVLTERSNVIPVLINNDLTKDDCFKIITAAGLELPRIYRQGYPNANCIGCVKATSPTYWNHVRNHHPSIFTERAELSRKLGARLVRVNGERIFLDELDPKATGRPMKQLPSIECGIFCEEKGGS
jgi:hypothetical protein